MNISLRTGIKLASCIFICELAGILGSFFTIKAIPAWYAGLLKPSLNPPSWIFGPVWTMLYALMGISLFLVWQQNAKSIEKRQALWIFGAQLIVNSLWTILFFGAHSPLYGLIDILLLIVLIVATIALFHRISKRSAYLLLPYLAWVLFATYLNYSIFRLN